MLWFFYIYIKKYRYLCIYIYVKGKMFKYVYFLVIVFVKYFINILKLYCVKCLNKELFFFFGR